MTQDSKDIINDIHEELEELSLVCIEEIENRQFSRKSKLPFKLATFVYAMSWRMKECSDGALKLIESGFVYSALMQFSGECFDSLLYPKSCRGGCYCRDIT